MTKAAAAGLRFDELVQTYYRAWFRFHPEAAVDAGVPGYAHLLTPCSEDAKGGLIYLNDEMRVALEELNPFVLDEDRRVDYELLWGAVQLENQYLLDLAPRRVDPRRWLPINAVYQLTVRPVEGLDHAVTGRVGLIPQHLQEAEADLSFKTAVIPESWGRSAALAARRGAEFMRTLLQFPAVAAISNSAELAGSADRAAQALLVFADFLERDVVPRAQGDFACGTDYFQRLLRLRHFLDVSPDRLHAFGEQLFKRTQAELEAACLEQFGHRDYLRAVHKIQSNHPPAEQLPRVYQERVRAAREFVIARGLVSVPERERLEVIETPVFMRHEIPFAAYSEPAPNDPDQVGRYYVTPPIDEAQLAQHDDVGIAHTCVHEGYPGHHLQFVTANLHPAARSLPRLLNASASLYEGWALYAEQLMHEQGFLDRPESRIVLLRDRLWRALRVMLDVELHTRGLTLDAAADRMVAALGFPRSQADADLAWYTRAPAVPLGYATGWAIIRALRKHATGEKVDALLSFHDRLLSAGSIAVRMVVRRAFGEKLWDAVKDDVFGERS